jgi:hypothetical protein
VIAVDAEQLHGLTTPTPKGQEVAVGAWAMSGADWTENPAQEDSKTRSIAARERRVIRK